MAKLFKLRVWILIIVLLISFFAINLNPFAEGIEIHSVDANSELSKMGLAVGDKVLRVNDKPVSTIDEFNAALVYLEREPVDLVIKTNVKEYNRSTFQGFGFNVDENLTVVDSEYISIDEIIKEINGNEINDVDDLEELEKELFPKEKLVIETDKGKLAFLLSGKPNVIVREARKSNLVKGLDLVGGTRALIKPLSERKITNQDINNLIDVIEERLNLYGLADVKFRTATVKGEKYILIEMAGVTAQDIKDLIGEQGEFEAKVGDDVVFNGGKGDVPWVCRDDGTCEAILSCDPSGEGYQCMFEFSIRLSQEAADKQYKRIADLSPSAENAQYLSESLDLYVDDKKVSSLLIGKDLQQGPTQDIVIRGPGFGDTEVLAMDDATREMNRLQTIMITGSLPVRIEFAKFETISPLLGQHFVKNAFLVAFAAILGVALVIYLRYRNFKILIPVMITSLSEVIVILGFAALFEWNLDLVAIAGIIAAVGTGVDDQIIITDEILKKSEQYYNWKQRIKRAFFIIMTAWATTIVAMMPLVWAGAGLVKGFAIVTMVGVTIGVLVTRPAFAAIAEYLLNK